MKSAGMSLICIAGSLLICASAAAQQSAGAGNSGNQPPKELAKPYRTWLNEDVAYIVTDQERSAFVHLQTDEAREQFIENFWLRRDPTPDTIENEFREEHYRRIAYANERFASGIPGWKTDRGRIYIVYGPPDEIDDHPSVGGVTPTYPVQQWRYRWIEGVGTNVLMDFVDPTMSGEFHMTVHPKNEPPLYLPGDAATVLEQMGITNQTRHYQGDGTHLAAPMTGPPEHMNEVTPAQPLVAPSKPKTKFPDLEARIYSRLIIGILPMKVRVDFFPITSGTVLTYVTVQFNNKDLQLKNTGGVLSANVHMFGEFTTVVGRVIESFEEDMQIPAGPRQYLADWLERKSLGQKILPLSPGTYRLVLVCKDDVGGHINIWAQTITVPQFDAGRLSTSTLILADSIEPVSARDVGNGEFVIGGSKVRPRIGTTFRRDEPLGVYMKLYNLGIDEQTRKPQGQVEYEVVRAGAGDVVVTTIEDIAKIPYASGSQVTVQRLQPLENLSPGPYTLRVTITDNNRNQTLAESAQFTVQ
jgi:GWxTD domain-containing protein